MQHDTDRAEREQYINKALVLADNMLAASHILGNNEGTSAAREALRAHLSTALKGEQR